MVKRIFFYITGFTIGAVFIFFLLMRGRSFDFWMPGERVKTEIIVRKPLLSDKASCQLECLSMNKDSLSSFIKSSEVNFKESNVHKNPCKLYLLDNKSEKIRMEFSVCDTVITLNSVTKENQVCTCN